MLGSGSFYAGDSHDHGGTSASIEQRSQKGAVDILKKHQNKTSTPSVGRLPDPRAMVEIRSGLEDERREKGNGKRCHPSRRPALQNNMARTARSGFAG